MSNKHMAFAALVDNQASPEVTINNALDAIAGGVNDFLSVSLASGNVSLTDAQYGQRLLFIGTGHTVARTLTVPLEIDTGTDSPRLFMVRNDGTVDGALTVTGGSGTTVVVPPGVLACIYSDGVNLVKLWDNVPPHSTVISAETGTTLAVVCETHLGRFIPLTNGVSCDVTLPSDTTSPFPINAEVDFYSGGAGVYTFLADTGVTLLYPASRDPIIAEQEGVVTAKKIAADTWLLVGLLAAA